MKIVALSELDKNLNVDSTKPYYTYIHHIPKVKCKKTLLLSKWGEKQKWIFVYLFCVWPLRSPYLQLKKKLTFTIGTVNGNAKSRQKQYESSLIHTQDAPVLFDKIRKNAAISNAH